MVVKIVLMRIDKMIINNADSIYCMTGNPIKELSNCLEKTCWNICTCVWKGKLAPYDRSALSLCVCE